MDATFGAPTPSERGRTPQHVVQRGHNREATFFAAADYHFYLDCLHEAAHKYGCLVHAYVLDITF